MTLLFDACFLHFRLRQAQALSPSAAITADDGDVWRDTLRGDKPHTQATLSLWGRVLRPVLPLGADSAQTADAERARQQRSGHRQPQAQTYRLGFNRDDSHARGA